MKTFTIKITLIIFLGILFSSTGLQAQADDSYVQNIRDEMLIKWPNNRTINFVFHGHSVPSGYYTAGKVYKYGAYPHLSIEQIKEKYPYAVVNSITTSIGGEQAEQGETRFAREVLTMRPDVLFIDYALNDRNIVRDDPQQSLKKAKAAWQKMIDAALAHSFTDRNGNVHEVKVYLMTPTPDTNEDILSDDAPLAQHAAQIRQLAIDNNVGLIDSYALFKDIASRESLSSYMAQANHVNEKGHQIVANEIAKLFLKEETVENGLYYVKGNYSQKFWTVKDGLSNASTQIIINDSLGTDHQKFYVRETTNGFYIKPYCTNKNLGMYNSGTANGANLVLLDSTGSANQRFSFTYAGNDHFWITNNNSEIYIATPGTETENGTKVFQWQFYNNPNFQWSFIPAETSSTNAGSAKSATNQELVNIYPNPAQDTILINVQNKKTTTASIYDLRGQLVFQSDFKTKIHINKNDLSASGIMLLQLRNDELNHVEKILIL